VRDVRQTEGLTLRALAKKASVSERFLVQLEAGEGNISVARLEDVAEALRTTGAALLSRASASGQARAQGARTAPRVVALVGLRGAGKSSIGAALAERLGVPFLELDEEIAREAQMTLSTIFEIHGEAYFRAMERDVLGRILAANEPKVVAAGGSIVTDDATWRLLRGRALTVWLKAKPRDHWDRVVAQGDVRPMRGRPRAMNELRQLLAARTPLYEEASLTLDTSALPPAEVVNRIATRIRGGE